MEVVRIDGEQISDNYLQFRVPISEENNFPSCPVVTSNCNIV